MVLAFELNQMWIALKTIFPNSAQDSFPKLLVSPNGKAIEVLLQQSLIYIASRFIWRTNLKRWDWL